MTNGLESMISLLKNYCQQIKKSFSGIKGIYCNKKFDIKYHTALGCEGLYGKKALY